MSKELGVCRSALLGLYSDRKSRQHIEECTNTVINEMKSLDIGNFDSSTIEVGVCLATLFGFIFSIQVTAFNSRQVFSVPYLSFMHTV